MCYKREVSISFAGLSHFFASGCRQRERKLMWTYSSFTISRLASCTHVRSLTLTFLITVQRISPTFFLSFSFKDWKIHCSEIHISLAKRLSKHNLNPSSSPKKSSYKNIRSAITIIVKFSALSNYSACLQPLRGFYVIPSWNWMPLKVIVPSLFFEKHLLVC